MSPMRKLFALLFALCAASAACGRGTSAPPPFKAVADNKLLMQAVIDPNANIVWDSVKTIVTRDGTQDVRPRNDEQWMSVRNAAVALTESGNLLMMVPRAKDGGEWMLRAQELVNTGEAAIRAVDARNSDRLFTVGGDIYDACSNCHRQYMPDIVNANK